MGPQDISLLFPLARKLALGIHTIAFIAARQFCDWGSPTGRAGRGKKEENKATPLTYALSGTQMLVFQVEKDKIPLCFSYLLYTFAQVRLPLG